MSDGFIPASAPVAAVLAARLIRHAARSAPPALAGRLEEEWLADLAAQPSSFAALSFALGCCWATRVIAREHRAMKAAFAAGRPKTTVVGQLRSHAMSRLKPVWIGAAALAVTALGVGAILLAPLAFREFATRVQPYLAGSEPAIGIAVSMAVSAGVVVGTLAWSIRQIRREAMNNLPKAPLAVLTLVMSLSSAGLFTLSARLGYVAMHLAGPEMLILWGVAGGAVGLIIALTSGRAKSRSAGNSAPDGGGEPGLGSAHYPRSRLRRGKWPGADRRYVP